MDSVKKKLLKEITCKIRSGLASEAFSEDILEKIKKELSTAGYKYDTSYPSISFPIGSPNKIPTGPGSLAEALLWKLNRWKSYIEFIKYYKKITNEPDNSGFINFQFANHLADHSNNPIVDQHTLRCYWAINFNLNEHTNNALKSFLVKSNGEWKESGSGKSGKLCCSEYVKFVAGIKSKYSVELDSADKLFMPLGSAIKEQFTNYSDFYEAFLE